jgi:hypothetical protein
VLLAACDHWGSMMTFKAIAAALTLLLVLASSLHNRAASATRAAVTSLEQRRGFELGVAQPAALREPAVAHGLRASHSSLENATLLKGVFDAAKQAGSSARSHVPEPKVLLLLGLALLLFGLRRGGKQGRNPPRR